MKSSKSVAMLALFSLFALTTSAVYAKGHAGERGVVREPKIYVTSQDLAYDTMGLANLPFNGQTNFQLLEMTGPTGAQTEFGPGDVGYYGGRWWVDTNGDGYMDEEDTFFLCPLLGPGVELEE